MKSPAAFVLLLGLALACAESGAGGLDVSFARGRWNTDEFTVVKSPRWSYVLPFEQREEAIVNPCPDVSGEEVFKKYNARVYAAMVHTNRFAFGGTISSTMAWDWRMAPIIVLTPDLGTSAEGVPEFREHWEVCLYDEGINVWHHTFEGGKPAYDCAAALKFRGAMRYPANARLNLVVTLTRRFGHKRMIVTCGDYELSYSDDALPETYRVGVIGCEGRNFFYDLKVKGASAK